MLDAVCYEKNILIIDGIRQSREILKQFAQSINALRIDTSHHAPDIISKCENIDYEVILLGYDLGENRKNGQQILEELRVKNLISRQCTIIMITAEITQSMVLAALEHKPDDYLTKPYTLGEISSRLEKCLLKKQAMAPIYNAMDNQNYNDVISLSTSMAEMNPQYRSECLGIISRQYYELEQYDLAKEIYLDYKNQENCQWAVIGLSKIAIINKDYLTAKNYLKALIEDYPHYLSSYDWLAKTYQLLEEPIKAEETLEKAISISPRSVPRLKRYADQCLSNQNFEKATNAYKNTHDLAYHSIHRKPENTINFAEALLEYSDQLSTYQIKQLNNKAFDALKKMTRDFKQPEIKVMSLLLTSRLHNKVKDFSLSLTALNEAERLLKKEDRDYSAKGTLSIAKHLISLNKKEMGKNLIHTLAESTPDDTELMLEISKIIEQPITDKNKIEAQSALEIGTNLYRTGQYKLAIDKLSQALTLFPYHIGIKLNLYQAIIVSMEHSTIRDKDVIKAKLLTREFNQLSVNSESYFRYQKLKKRYDDVIEENN
ncbi:tetratricopeptide repeat-containing response regulator [Pseudocolwellia agarivorans]|uniref:tetratricopeptide repeat-containing response regulator n=1 Tax=Pseudocolwellia agarivorans TaxID=1911682 RepID=UPI000987BF94|nr:tetratricopeptide repeat-containing response regulator [Pseudocolwellia agarivorans]